MRSLNELAAEILLGKNVTWDVVRAVARLMLAYADYNCAAADSKSGRRSPSSRDVVVSLEAFVDDLEGIHVDCENAWTDFRKAEWPRGEPDVWSINNKRLLTVLERTTEDLRVLQDMHFGVPAP